MKYLKFVNDEIDLQKVGGKAAALVRLSRAGFPVPEWCVVTSEGFKANAATVREELASAVASLGVGERFAVRSSGAEEDSAGHSFAGQFDTYLFVEADGVAEKVERVWHSGFSERVSRYRQEHGLGPATSAPAVLIQRMVDADAAGVAFSADPVTGRRSVAVVSAVLGLGTQLVGGDGDADTWQVDSAGRIMTRAIAEKGVAHRFSPTSGEGVAPMPVRAQDQRAPALSDTLVSQVAELARACADHFGQPQDIEWAAKEGRLYLLQSRPITTLKDKSDPDGELAVFDNSNIAESYGGITTPLTFSFARHAYAGVYREFCKLMSVPAAAMEANDGIFAHMLGLIRGRVYYNLLNWYRLLAMLPGFAANRGFMEGMMGVREPLPEELTAKVLAATAAGGGSGRLAVARSILGLVRNHLSLTRQIRDFYVRLEDALRPAPASLLRLRYDELTVEFRRLESLLLKRWDAPLVNDFFAMIYFGLLGKLCGKWLGPELASLHNELIREGGGIISAEPAQRINRIAGMVAQSHPDLVDTLCDGPPFLAVRAVSLLPALSEEYQSYLQKFGDRCLEELKLESPTLDDDPTPLLRAIGHAARRQLSGEQLEAKTPEERRLAETRARELLRRHPIRSVIFGFVLRQGRARVRDRENLRFERTRVFGRCRRIFVECGKRLAAQGMLDEPRDVFYLELDEVMGLSEATASTVNIRQLVALRKTEFDQYRQDTAPADRFETRGAVHLGNTFAASSRPDAANADATIKGLGCCAGIVRGPVRVIRDPRGAQLRAGEIMVAERTDPGWIMLFPAAAGILVERGSLLSHSAIVAREMGIPAIVSINDVTRRLADGQWIEMDGAAGTVRLLDGPTQQGASGPQGKGEGE